MVINHRCDSKNITVVHNWSLVAPSFHVNSSNPTFINIVLMGNIGRLHMPELLVATANKLVSSSQISAFKTFIRGEFSFYVHSNLVVSEKISHNPICVPEELRSHLLHPTVIFTSLDSVCCNYAFPSRITTAVSNSCPVIFLSNNHKSNPVSQFVKDNKIDCVLIKMNRLILLIKN